MVTKSGTNQYHGNAYDYTTNEALNAHQPYTGARNMVKQHDFGYTVGGPVWIPKIYDGKNKTFFFWSYERFRNKNIKPAIPPPCRFPPTGRRFQQPDHGGGKLITKSAGNTTDALGRTIASGTIFDPNTQQVVMASTSAIRSRTIRIPWPASTPSPTKSCL